MVTVINRVASDIIKSYEGFKPKSLYLCWWHETIGYGHVIRKNEEIFQTITKVQA